ncbi:MAG: hypothetical protein AAGA03_08115 [Planctomycetota bacterium]
MAKQELTESKPMRAIREFANQFPEVIETDSCVNRAFKAANKSFLFMGMKEDTYNLRIKLCESLPEVEALEADDPGAYSVGAHGWVHIVLPHTKAIPKKRRERWISESFRLLAPKRLVTTLDAK